MFDIAQTLDVSLLRLGALQSLSVLLGAYNSWMLRSM